MCQCKRSEAVLGLPPHQKVLGLHPYELWFDYTTVGGSRFHSFNPFFFILVFKDLEKRSIGRSHDREPGSAGTPASQGETRIFRLEQIADKLFLSSYSSIGINRITILCCLYMNLLCWFYLIFTSFRFISGTVSKCWTWSLFPNFNSQMYIPTHL